MSIDGFGLNPSILYGLDAGAIIGLFTRAVRQKVTLIQVISMIVFSALFSAINEFLKIWTLSGLIGLIFNSETWN